MNKEKETKETKQAKVVRSRRERLLGLVLDIPFVLPLMLRFYARVDWIWFQVTRRIFTVNRPTKAQQDQIILIIFATPVAVAVLWYYVVMVEKEHLVDIRRRAAYAGDILNRTTNVRHKSDDIAAKLEKRRQTLARKEAILLPSWDSYAWMVGTVGSFSSTHQGVRINSFSPPRIGDVAILPKFPYRWATFHMSGTGYYHEFGSFVADLESVFPYFCVQNVILVPDTSPGAKRETLVVNFDVSVPVLAEQTE